MVKTENGEGEASDKVCEIAAAPASERFVFFPPVSRNEMGEKNDRSTNTAGLEQMHNIWHFKVQSLFNKQ